MYHKDTDLSSRKIDWLLLHRRDDLRKIMHDNGNYDVLIETKHDLILLL